MRTVAQLDRAAASEAVGQKFESSRRTIPQLLAPIVSSCMASEPVWNASSKLIEQIGFKQRKKLHALPSLSPTGILVSVLFFPSQQKTSFRTASLNNKTAPKSRAVLSCVEDAARLEEQLRGELHLAWAVESVVGARGNAELLQTRAGVGRDATLQLRAAGRGV